jgi:hypothetical protein
MRISARSFLVAFILKLALGLMAVGVAFAANTDEYDERPSARALAAGLAARQQHRAEIRKRGLWTLIDYERPFTAVRLWVLDPTRDHAVVTSSRVSHAWKSGLLHATRFSNVEGSNLSSPGSFVTAVRPYNGRFGQSLRIRGLDRGINHNAWKRDIIFHPDLGMSHSLGCFMLPDAVARGIVDTIAGGSFVFVYTRQP